MLVVVNQPRIEISLNGEGAKEALDWLSKKFKVEVINDDTLTDSITVENSDFWKEMQGNRVGNLLAGYRLKAGLTQKQLADKVGIKQNMISDYESGKRRLSKKMGERIAPVLGVKAERFL